MQWPIYSKAYLNKWVSRWTKSRQLAKNILFIIFFSYIPPHIVKKFHNLSKKKSSIVFKEVQSLESALKRPTRI